MTGCPGWFAIVLAASACARGAPSPDTTRSVLRAQTQALLDAVSAGDPAVWQRYIDPSASYVSENGTVETKQSVVAHVTPLPAGISGKLEIDEQVVRQYGDIAISVYLIREQVSYFGHPLTAEYRQTDTWRHGRDGWRLIAAQVLAVQRDPEAVTLPDAELDEYVGSYRVSATVDYTIRRDGGRLIGQRTGGPPQELRAELRDVLFIPGQPRSRKIFSRDAAGKIAGFVDRREGRDIGWQRQPSR